MRLSTAPIPTEAGAASQIGDDRDAWWFRAASWLLILAICAAPLAFGGVEPWAWGALQALVSLVFLLWLAGSVGQREFRVVWSPLYLPALLLLLLGAVQVAFRLTLDWTSSREAVLKLALDLLLFFLANQLLAGGSRRTLRQFGFTVCLFAFLLSMFALLQLFSSENKIYWTIPSPNFAFGPYVNRNHYAGLMELLIPVSAGYVACQRARVSVRLLLAFMVLIPFVSVCISGSRGGMLSLGAEIVLTSVVLWRLPSSELRRPLLVVTGAALATTSALALWLVTPEVSEKLAESAHASTLGEPSITARLSAAADSLRMLEKHPWIGTGMGSFEAVFPSYQSFPSDRIWDHAHNDYAEALAETGLAGAVLVAAEVILFLRLAFSGVPSRLTSRANWIPFGAAVGCCGVLIHSLADFNLHLPANAAWFSVCAAVACRKARNEARQQVRVDRGTAG